MPDINGIPYVESTDLVSAYPAASQSLAQAVSDELASKPTKTSDTVAPTSPAEGDLWFDENTTPPTAKFWDGSAWQTFSAGAADFSNAATGTYTDTGVDYKYLTFTASGTLTVTRAGFADILIVGGGGGGGSYSGGGGGGAGGYLYATDAYLPADTLTVTVGAGGAAGVDLGSFVSWSDGNNGNASGIGDYWMPGGGGGPSTTAAYSGGDRLATRGLNGGSGGGACGFAVGGSGQTGGLGVSPIGNNGGDSVGGAGGGGGGSSAAGTTAPSAGNGGAGGNGTANAITGSSVTRAGGGGGGGSSAAGAAGSGSAGAGGTSGTGGSGAANTGSGGGGSFSGNGGPGGSGVVIVRVRT